MKKTTIVSLGLGVLLFTACSSSEPEANQASGITAEIETVKVSTTGQEKTTADIAVSGMSCEMMCVGKVTEALTALEGVNEVSFPEFNGENKFNHAKFDFDPNKVSEEEMISAINSLFDGNTYQVGKVVVEQHVKAKADAASNEPEAGSSNEESLETTSFSVPNLFDLVTELF